MILEATACIGVPAGLLWMRTVGLMRILAVLCAALWAFHEGVLAGRARYWAVYRETRALQTHAK